ncbi:hypothetical protein DW66_5562 [Pseudomonas putida]|nr:hypothetical protein DW66_5442 [Pseudomonas putida]AHZ80058.1 hypothetical protein DW66_5562 [Pseudomonas putida]AJG16332.1 hypothetical protein RK21_04824 [Pseudomonas plecoglossicida]
MAKRRRSMTSGRQLFLCRTRRANAAHCSRKGAGWHPQ